MKNNEQEILAQVLEAMPGVLVTDADGKIVYVNKAYAKILQVEPDDVVGCFCSDIVPGSRMSEQKQGKKK